MDFIVIIFTMILITLILAFTPYYIRRSESFGVSIPESQHGNPMLNKMRLDYCLQMLITGLVLTAITAVSTRLFPQQTWPAVTGCLTIVLASFILYISKHRQSILIKKEARWEERISRSTAVELGPANQSGAVPLSWTVVFWFIVLLTIGVSVFWYPNIPGQIPMNYDLAGNPYTYSVKSPGTVAFMPLTMIFVGVVFTFVLVTIRHSRTMIAVDNPVESLYRSGVFRYRWSIFLILMGCAIMMLLMLIQFSIIGLVPVRLMIWATFIILAAILGGSVFMVAHLGQGGSRLKYKNHKDSEAINYYDDDRFWLLGLIYFNRNDSAIFVEKRFGVGWTCNMGHPLTWLMIVLIILAVLAITLYSSTISGR